MKARPYRPSNGSEGMAFCEAWCNVCVLDADGACPILANTLAYNLDNPKYPKEWVEDEKGPRCTAFIAAGEDAETVAARNDPRQIGLPL